MSQTEEPRSGGALLQFVALTTIRCLIWAFAFVLTGVIVGSAWASIDSTLGRALLGI
jgi:membrane protein DedA with SNARE-associated domain